MEFSDLRGRVAVVTGGARGLGYSTAEAYAAQGCSVALLDILPEVAESARTLAEKYGVATHASIVDVTDAESVAVAFAGTREVLGTPQILLTAAGITIWNDSVDVPPVEWRKVIAVNLDGTFFAAQEFGRGLLEAELPGSAIFISSMSGSIINIPQNQASYSASKAAVAQLAKALGVEWAKSGIRVNAISPGYVLSDMTKQFTEQNPQLASDWVGQIPLGRMAQPSDLHGLIVYLASDAASYMTAQNIVIDGGYTAL